MSVIIIRGDARRLPLPDEAVDLIVTPAIVRLSTWDEGDLIRSQTGGLRSTNVGQMTAGPGLPAGTKTGTANSLWGSAASNSYIFEPTASALGRSSDRYSQARSSVTVATIHRAATPLIGSPAAHSTTTTTRSPKVVVPGFGARRSSGPDRPTVNGVMSSRHRTPASTSAMDVNSGAARSVN